MADVSKIVFSSPVSAYHAIRDKQTGAVKVVYDDKKMIDEETEYNFNPDGSANSLSYAWGNKTEYPAGTFSDLMLNLPKTEELTSEMAKQMVDAYRKVQEEQKTEVKN